jgi:hypothetical protein
MAAVGRAEPSAKQLLAEGDVSGPPVPVEEIARELGVRVYFEHFDQDISGILYRDGANSVIGVQATHPKTRQRFTIAHEIGHLRLHKGPMFLDHSVRVDRRDEKASLGIDLDEIEANSFAAALLMRVLLGAPISAPTARVGAAQGLIQAVADVPTQNVTRKIGVLRFRASHCRIPPRRPYAMGATSKPVAFVPPAAHPREQLTYRPSMMIRRPPVKWAIFGPGSQADAVRRRLAAPIMPPPLPLGGRPGIAGVATSAFGAPRRDGNCGDCVC